MKSKSIDWAFLFLAKIRKILLVDTYVCSPHGLLAKFLDT